MGPNGQRPAGGARLLERWAWGSIALNILLSALNLGMALTSSSVAIAAEMVHNVVDLAASVAVLVGLKISRRRSQEFPYGLHKVENLVAAGVAILIFVAAYELINMAILGARPPLVIRPWILAGVAASAALPFAFSVFEGRAARRANSPSLWADAKEFRVHVLTSGVVLVALVVHLSGSSLPLEPVAAVIVVLAVLKTGWELLSDAMRVLLDASLDQQTLGDARRIIDRHPAVVGVREIRGHNAGRFRFLEAVVDVRVRELQQADVIGRELEGSLCEEIPFVERALVDVRRGAKEVLRAAIPLDGPDGAPSDHFGTAPHFLLADRPRHAPEIRRRDFVTNRFAGGPRGRGLKVAHWLIEEGVDVVITRDDIAGKGPGHAFGEAGVTVVVSPTEAVDEALAQGFAALGLSNGAGEQ